MASPIRVGIIGANASGGWAREGHVPAVQTLQGLELVAVATNSQQTAAAGGRPPETPFSLDMVGETGTLRLTGGAARGFQSGRITLALNGAPQSVDEGELASLPDAAANVGGIYAALRNDITDGTFTVAGFHHAVKLTQLLTDLFSSSLKGVRAEATNWPEQ